MSTVPQDLSPYERRQQTFLQLRNRKIRMEYFTDVIDTTPDDSPRRVLMNDLLIEDNDSLADMWLKDKLFQEVTEDDAPLFLPNYDDMPVSVLDKPHVHLHFIEKKGTAIAARRKRAEALISFRLVDKTISTVTQSDINELKREINLAFPSTYQVKKGRFKYSYRDKKNGFELILTLLNETEAREVITKVLGIRDKTPDWDNLTTSTSEKNFTVRKTVTILSQVEKLPYERPITDCYLKQAVIAFGKLKKIVLLERAV